MNLKLFVSFYEIEDTLIFAWSSILDVGQYHWLRNLIRQLPLNSKADYFVHTMTHLRFPTIMNYHYGIA
jgi:hypothetical protein